MFGAIAYLILASGEKQWWADGVESTSKKHVPLPSSAIDLQPLNSDSSIADSEM